jgi:hypothetical protein
MIIIGSIEKKHSRFENFYFVNFYLYKNIHKAMFLKEAAQTILTGGLHESIGAAITKTCFLFILVLDSSAISVGQDSINSVNLFL